MGKLYDREFERPVYSEQSVASHFVCGGAFIVVGELFLAWQYQRLE